MKKCEGLPEVDHEEYNVAVKSELATRMDTLTEDLTKIEELKIEEIDLCVLATAITQAAELNHKAGQSIARSILHLSHSIRQYTNKLPSKDPRMIPVHIGRGGG